MMAEFLFHMAYFLTLLQTVELCVLALRREEARKALHTLQHRGSAGRRRRPRSSAKLAAGFWDLKWYNVGCDVVILIWSLLICGSLRGYYSQAAPNISGGLQNRTQI